jgi:O-antigen/teichoic acid export membrane protein
MTSTRTRVAGSIVILLIENLVRVGVVAMVTLWIARSFGPAQFGVLAFGLAAMALALAVTTLGLESRGTIAVSKARRPGTLLGTIIVMRLVAGVVVLPMVGLALLAIRPGDQLVQVVTLLCVLAIFGFAFSTLDFWFKARIAPWPAAAARIGTALLSSAFKVLVLLAGLGLLALAATVALEGLVLAGLLGYAYARSAAGKHGSGLAFDRRLVAPLLVQGAPMLVAAFATVTYMRADNVLLGVLGTDSDVGVYALSQRLAEIVFVAPVVVIDSVFAALIRHRSDSGPLTPQRAQFVFDAGIFAALGATAVALIVVPLALPILFGEAYAASVAVFAVYAWVAMPVALAYAQHKWLAYAGLARYAPALPVTTALLAIALNVWMIPRYGPLGAAAGTLFAHVAATGVVALLLPPLRQVSIMQCRALWPWGRLWRWRANGLRGYQE